MDQNQATVVFDVIDKIIYCKPVRFKKAVINRILKNNAYVNISSTFPLKHNKHCAEFDMNNLP